MAAILNSANLNSTILDSAILVFPLKLTHTCQHWFPPFAQKKLHSFILSQLDDGSHLEFGHLGISHLCVSSQTRPHLPRLVPTISKKKNKKLHSLFPLHHLLKIFHSFNLINLMMAAILNSAILDSAIMHKTLTQTNSIWLKLIDSHSTWWWQPSWIWILPSSIQLFFTKKTSLIHSDSTWWWWPSWILPSCIQPFCTKLWLKLIQSDSNSFILSQLDDGSHLEFCHVEFRHCNLGFRHFVIFSQIHSKILSLQSDSESN